MKDSLKSLCAEAELSISDNKIHKLEQFVNLFIEKNKMINLTKFKDRQEFLVKHILDALFLTKFFQIKSGINIADVATGGGLPGIPLAILYQEAFFTLIDSVQKKIRCVGEFANELHLQNIRTVTERLEVIGKNKSYREQFDLVLARALGPLPVLLELAFPLVKKGGVLVAFKGPAYLEEINDAESAMRILKSDKPKVEHYELPRHMGDRFLLIFKKSRPTPNIYPRRVGMPKKKPL